MPLSKVLPQPQYADLELLDGPLYGDMRNEVLVAEDANVEQVYRFADEYKEKNQRPGEGGA